MVCLITPSHRPVSVRTASSLMPSTPPPPGQVAELREEFQRENEELLEAIRQLSREVSLQTLLMNSFIPQEYQVCPRPPPLPSAHTPFLPCLCLGGRRGLHVGDWLAPPHRKC